MLEVRIGGVVCRFSLLFPAMVAVAVTLDPSVFSLWCLAASLMHEMGHLIALLAFDSWKPFTDTCLNNWLIQTSW